MTPINWEDSSWKHLSLVNDEEVISLSHAKVYVSSDFVLCLGKVNQNPTSNSAWEEKLSCFKSSTQYRTLDTIDGEPMEFEWNLFSRFTTLQLCNKVQEFMSKMSDPSQFKGRIIIKSMFNDILRRSEDNERECDANADLVSIYTKRFPAGRWSFLELVKKIESHPHRQALQADLQQNNAYNPFSGKSKKMIKIMSELCETIPEVQCKAMRI